jgi:predicted Zn finger-like uncharacterized protein
MLIVCPHCSTNYEVGAKALGEAGRTVRCARCHKTWFATAMAPAAAMAEAAAEPPATIHDAAAEAAAPPPEAPRPDAGPKADELWSVPELASPPIAPTTVDAVAEPVPAHDIESLAARRAGGAARRGGKRPGGRLGIPVVPAIIALELAAVVGILVWRTEIVRAMPQTASLFRAVGMPVNLRGLAFTDVHTESDSHDGTTTLIVEGTVENATHAAVGVPRLRFALRNAARVELMSWTAPPDQASLAPGESLPFRSRLASPPADGHDVVVRFLTRVDIENGTR